MPTSARGFTLPDPDGNFNIYINARIGKEMQMQAYEHELRHIDHGDFERDDAAAVELSAHGLTQN
jgi:hypothetical protein